MALVLLIIALVLFILAAIPKVPQPFNFVALGLAFWEGAQLVGGPIGWPLR
jgi:hypothetical protein